MKRRILLLGLAGILLLSGCGSSAKDSSANMSMEAAEGVATDYSVPEEPMEEAAVEEAAAGSEGGTLSVEQVAKKLIVTEYIDAETTEFDDFLTTVNQKVDTLGGYIETSEISGSSEYANRYASFKIRIPAEKREEFVSVVDETGNVVYNRKTTEDVTLQYVDTESHLNALKVEEETLLSLLEKAEKLSDVFDIQARLTEVRYQMESYESQLRVYDNQVDYSTVNLNVNEVKRETTQVKQGFWSEATAEFSDTLYYVGQSLRGFAIWFIGSIPVFAVWAVVIVVVVILVKRSIRKRRLKKMLMHTDAGIDGE